MASAIGVARMPTQGSWRPLVTTSTGLLLTSIDWRGLMIELVGLIAMLTSRSCPVLMPPSTPPALLVTKPSGVIESPCVVPRCVDAGEAGADLHALDRVDAHHGVGDVGIQLVEQRLAQAHRHASMAVTRMRAPQESPALRSASM